MNLEIMREKRGAYMNTMRSIVDRASIENRGLTAAEQKDWDGLMVKVKELGGTLDRASQFGEMRADIERPIATAPVTQQDGGMTYGGSRGLEHGEVRAYKPTEAIAESRYNGPGLGAYVRGIITGNWKGAEELRALAEGSDPGGYLVPTPLSMNIIDKVRNRAQVLRAGALTLPMHNQTLKVARQTGDVTAAWKAENAAITFSDTDFDVVTFSASMLTAGSKLSIEMCEDAINIDQIVNNSISKSLALALDYAALYGSGSSNQPTGVKNQSGVTITTLATNGYTLTDFSKYSAAISTLEGANFEGPFGIIHSARTAGELDNLQDTLHQPLRQPDKVAAAKKFTSNQIPNNLTVGTGTTCSDAFVGQWDQCLFGIRTGLMLEISRQAADSSGSAFTNAQVWVRAYLRADVQLAHPLAFNVLSGIL